MASSATPRVELIGKPGCHLCELAETVVSKVSSELGVAVRYRSILDEPELFEKYQEMIPVLLVDGELVSYWRITEDKLRAALLK